MRFTITSKFIFALLALGAALPVQAEITSAGVLDNILDRYSYAASTWAAVVTSAASWLFWTLALISMVWTFGMMALRKADIGDFFAEFVRFTVTTGLFWWALVNGPAFATSIYDSLRQVAGEATGLGRGLSPSGIVDVGFAIYDRVLDQSSLWSPVDSAIGLVIALTILTVLALVGVNMLLLLCSAWVLAYGGIFFLGFGGARWTSDMAINYYKTVLGIAAQLFTMVLLVGIGKTFLDDYYGQMSAGVSLKEMGVMLIVSIILLMLVNKIPPLIAGVITGASVGGMGIGSFGAGAALGAAATTAAATSMAGAAIAAGSASAAGGAQALMSAFSAATANVAAGTDILSTIGGAFTGESVNGVSGESLSFADAAGFDGGTPAANGDSRMSFGGSASTGLQETGDDLGKGGNGASVATDSLSSQGGKPRGAFAFAANMGRIFADAGANLAQGAVDVAGEKFSSMKDAVLDRIAETTGGRIAQAIGANGADTDHSPTFDFDSLTSGGSQDADPESEVAAFRDRNTQAS